MKCLAIIPARGGSKGIPGKNIKLVAGKPLLAYSIEHALQTPAINRVVVSTDDAAIALVAEKYGAEIIHRPSEISGDTATSESALLHVLDLLRDQDCYDPDLVVFLQATSPLRQSDDIRNAIETLIKEKADSLFSACRLHAFAWRNENGILTSITYDYRNRQRRQDAPEDLIENGSIYVFKPWVLRELGNRLGGKIAVYRMPDLDSFQVDEPADLQLIEYLLPLRMAAREAGRIEGVRLLALDFDGVLTDNRVLVNEDGVESVLCDRGDGWGIARLIEAGIEVVVVSTEVNDVVAARCRKLNIECRQSCMDKLSVLKEFALRRELRPEKVAFVGNDINDLECMGWAGLPIAVADAESQVRSAARIVTRKTGGHGAVREVAEMILRGLR